MKETIPISKYPTYLVPLVSFLCDREYPVRVRETLTVPRKARARVPQGSALPSIILNIITQDIPTHSKVSTALYAEDITLTSSRLTVNTCASDNKNHLSALER